MEFNDLKPYEKEVIAKHFNYTKDFDFLDVISCLYCAMEDAEDYSQVYEAVDSSLIYTKDTWAVIKHYCEPFEVDKDAVYEQLIDDLITIRSEIIREEKKHA